PSGDRGSRGPAEPRDVGDEQVASGRGWLGERLAIARRCDVASGDRHGSGARARVARWCDRGDDGRRWDPLDALLGARHRLLHLRDGAPRELADGATTREQEPDLVEAQTKLLHQALDDHAARRDLRLLWGHVSGQSREPTREPAGNRGVMLLLMANPPSSSCPRRMTFP